ncbi:MAG TPA: transposase [Xanthomonadales bacterium]|nr:transposase [Xanthomonadales bacterium]
MNTHADTPETGHIALRRGRVSIPGQLYLVTTCTADRIPCFAAEAAARDACEVLADPRTWPGAHPLVWVLMPDHWHGLIRLTGIESLSIVMARAKAAVRRASAARTDEPLWQRSFHDHALRSDEGVIDVGRYVLANPVRADLVSHWSDWRWRGGEWLAAFEAELPWSG